MTIDDATVGLPLGVEGTHNLRDVGGYPAAGGRLTAPGVLYRADALHELTDTGREALAGLGLRRIIDLRSQPEVAGAPSSLGGLEIETRNFSVLRAAAPSAQPGQRHTLDRLYQLMIDRRGRYLAGALRALVAADGPVLVHCTAGKDRTGVFVALTLDAVGVEREAIVADYAASERNLAGEWAGAMVSQISAGWDLSEDDIVAIVTTSPAATMRGLLDHLDSTHGGSATYLRAHGLTAEELLALRDQLTVADG